MKQIVTTSLAMLLMLSGVFALQTTIRPDSQGAYASWSATGCSAANGYQCVDEASTNTADYVQTGTNGAKETFGFGNVALNQFDQINSITLSYYAQRVKAADACFSPMIRSGGTNYLSGVQYCTGASYSLYSRQYNTNPATGSAWTLAEVNALEAGMYGLDPNGGGRVAQVYATINYTAATCSDTDGGFIPTVAGTVSGTQSGVPFSFSDSCIDATTVLEYFCGGGYQSSSVPCGSVEMNGTNVTGSCNSGACTYP